MVPVVHHRAGAGVTPPTREAGRLGTGPSSGDGLLFHHQREYPSTLPQILTRVSSPEYEPQANVLAERCDQIVKRMFKTTRSALEGRLGTAVPDDHQILTWIVRHAACLYNRYHVGEDGHTPWERVACKRSHPAAAEFGERVMFMTRAGPTGNVSGGSAFGWAL